MRPASTRVGRVTQATHSAARVSVTMASAAGSLLRADLRRAHGVDPYTTAVSDAYQDLSTKASTPARACMTSGICRVARRACRENALLSHDLFRGPVCARGPGHRRGSRGRLSVERARCMRGVSTAGCAATGRFSGGSFRSHRRVRDCGAIACRSSHAGRFLDNLRRSRWRRPRSPSSWPAGRCCRKPCRLDGDPPRPRPCRRPAPAATARRRRRSNPGRYSWRAAVKDFQTDAARVVANCVSRHPGLRDAHAIMVTLVRVGITKGASRVGRRRRQHAPGGVPRLGVHAGDGREPARGIRAWPWSRRSARRALAISVPMALWAAAR